MGFEQLKNIIDWNKKQAILDEQEAMNPTDCPTCGWTLEEHPDGTLHCPFDGWTNRLSISRRGR